MLGNAERHLERVIYRTIQDAKLAGQGIRVQNEAMYVSSTRFKDRLESREKRTLECDPTTELAPDEQLR